MRTLSTRLLCAACILIVLSCCSCRARRATTFTAESARAEVSASVSREQLQWRNLVMFDSVIELTPRDTLRRVRYVRLTSSVADTLRFASTELLADSSARVTQTIQQEPFTAQSNKRGQAWLCSIRVIGLAVIFFVFAAILHLIVKFFIYLRRN